jgi:hypothetical protein
MREGVSSERHRQTLALNDHIPDGRELVYAFAHDDRTNSY